MLRIVLIATIALGFMTALSGAAMLPLGGVSKEAVHEPEDVLSLAMGTPRIRADLMDVAATFKPVDGGAPYTLMISLKDGEDISVVLPGYRAQRFTFQRKGNIIFAQSQMTGLDLAEADIRR